MSKKKYGIQDFMKIKKISQLKVFKDKIDFNQYPGKKFWKDKIKILIINLIMLQMKN